LYAMMDKVTGQNFCQAFRVSMRHSVNENGKQNRILNDERIATQEKML